MDIITNNIANSTTIGFKEDELISRSFQDVMLSKIDHSSVVNMVAEVGPYNNGIHIDEVVTHYIQGQSIQTDKATDFFINGDGFFVLDTPQGERYTRDGSFKISEDGYLVNQDGYMVMGQNGAVYLGTNQFTVAANGDIIIDNIYIDRLQIVTFEDTNDLRKEGNNLYTGNNANPVVNIEGKIVQGSLEASNVDIVKSITDMMKVYRTYESNQRVIGILDQTLGKAVNDIGRV